MSSLYPMPALEKHCRSFGSAGINMSTLNNVTTSPRSKLEFPMSLSPTFTTTPTQSSHSLMVAMRLSRSLKDLEYNSSWICCKVPDEALLVETMMSTNRSNGSNHEPYTPIRKPFFTNLGCVFEGLHHRVLKTVDL